MKVVKAAMVVVMIVIVMAAIGWQRLRMMMDTAMPPSATSA